MPQVTHPIRGGVLALPAVWAAGQNQRARGPQLLKHRILQPRASRQDRDHPRADRSPTGAPTTTPAELSSGADLPAESPGRGPSSPAVRVPTVRLDATREQTLLFKFPAHRPMRVVKQPLLCASKS